MKKKLTALLFLALILSAIVAAAACGGGAAPTPTPAAAPLQVPPNTMIIKGGAFYPKELTIKLGETVTFINQDDQTYTLRDGKYGPDFYRGGFGKGGKWEFTFEKTGDFEIGDTRSAELRGMVHVTP